MIPLYGFLEGDTMGLLILAYEDETVEDLAKKLQRSARIRVPSRSNAQLIYQGQVLQPDLKLSQVGIEALDRFDVILSEDDDGI